MKKSIMYFGIFLLVVLSFILYPRQSTQTHTLRDVPTLEERLATVKMNKEKGQESPQSMDAIPVERAPTAVPATISKTEIKTIRDSLPQKEQVNKEVKANPHTPSPSLMNFAKQLGPAMEKAFKSETDATLLSKELRACAVNPTIADAARALCIQDVEKLSGYHPVLKKDVDDLRATASPAVRKILETNDAVLRN